MAPTLSLAKYFYAAIVTLTILGLVFGLHVWDKQRAVSLAVQNVELVYKAKLADANTAKAELEASLKENAHISRKATDVKIGNITRERDNALRSLLNRPRREDSAATSISGGTCTGAQLPREDAEFLTREASRAEKVREERDYYYNEYENARAALERYAKQRQDARQ